MLGFGRVDLRGDDGVWIVAGRLTDRGKEAIRAFEKEEILVHLVSPSGDLLSDLLSAASKPFYVTGQYEITESQVDRVVEKGVVLGIDFDPKKVDDFIDRLEEMKDRVGRRECLAAYLVSTEGLDEARRPLYLGLRERGWAHREICGARYRREGVAGGNLEALGGAPSRRSYR
jgi:hypothetical protein